MTEEQEAPTVTVEQIRAFIKAQPDDRPLKFDECISDRGCGCVMVHYGKEVLQLECDFSCTFDLWERTYGSNDGTVLAVIETSILNICRLFTEETYGELKRNLGL